MPIIKAEELIKRFIVNHKISGKIIVAVSGGKDSVCMLHILNKCYKDILVAHCNYKLRGEESDGDEKFVKTWCQKLNLPFISKTFETELYRKKNKLSLQEAARNLRYKWFEELRIENKCTYIAVAHHMEDNAETIMLNLFNGSGIRGLTGMAEMDENRKIIRPLLSISNEDIENYIIENKLEYREDSSNNETKYRRNYIRKKVIPEIKKQFPSVIANINKTALLLKENEKLLNSKINELETNAVIHKNNLIQIDLFEVNATENFLFYLFELINRFEFNFSDCNEIKTAYINNVQNKTWLSTDYEALLFNGELIIRRKKTVEHEKIQLTKEGIYHLNGKVIQYTKTNEKPININADKNICICDAEKLAFPLTWQKWISGSKIYPEKFRGSKKISDYLTEKKFNKFMKDAQTAVYSNNETVWLTGICNDRRFSINKETKIFAIFKVEN